LVRSFNLLWTAVGYTPLAFAAAVDVAYSPLRNASIAAVTSADLSALAMIKVDSGVVFDEILVCAFDRDVL
jgi:hypothetical protein